MKIAITGHTNGIGKAIADACEAEGHEVVGFSRSTGYYLFTDIDAVVNDADDCDVFVNNRYHYHNSGQLDLLYKMFNQWRHQDKQIINIGSRSGTYPAMGRIDPYAVNKQALDTACEQLNILRDLRPRVTNIKPGYVDTFSVKHITDQPKLKPEAVAEAVIWVINQPKLVHVSSVSLAHMQYG